MSNLLILIVIKIVLIQCVRRDGNNVGYLLFCPCMGRFGNQVDQFLGTLSFAKSINRTLVLPPWVEYQRVQEYTSAILMEHFMHDGDKLWPVGQRIGKTDHENAIVSLCIAFCYGPRMGSEGCNPKEGNPFGPFWDTFNVNFDGSEFFAPLHHSSDPNQWKQKYPNEKFPVLAFASAPAPFPVPANLRRLQKYLNWTPEWDEKAKKFIKSKFPKGSYVAVHLRNGPDWQRACQLIHQGSKSLFASSQCLGENNEFGIATMDLCNPSKRIIIDQVKAAIRKIKAVAVYIATDHDAMMSTFQSALSKMNVTVIHLEMQEPHLDLIILGKSNYFIGNCISSYSAFVKRHRDTLGLLSEFWAYKFKRNSLTHEEF